MKKIIFLTCIYCAFCFFLYSISFAQQTQSPELFGASMKLWDSGDISIGSLSKGGLGINIQPSGYVYFVSSLTGPAAWYNAVVANNDAGYANLVYRHPYGHVSWDRGDGYRYARLGFGKSAYGPGMENVKNLTDPLEIVAALRGVSYDLSPPPDTVTRDILLPNGQVRKFEKNSNTPDSVSGSESKAKIHCLGFHPEELMEVIPEAVTRLSANEGDYAIDYDVVIPYLVEAIKQLSKQVVLLNPEQRLPQFKDSDMTTVKNGTESILFQNRPNPFSDKTTITFKLMPSVMNASILLFDMQGVLIKSFNDLKSSCCEVIIESHGLKPGMYLYSLITDGKEVDTKRLILTD